MNDETPKCCNSDAEYKQFQNFAYWFCQQCKQEVSDNKPPEQAFEENTSFDFGMNVPGDYAAPLYVYHLVPKTPDDTF